MINIDKPIRQKGSKEQKTLKISTLYTVCEKGNADRTFSSLTELDEYYENIPEKEYTFQEACEELINHTSEKFVRGKNKCSLLYNGCKFVDEDYEDFQFLRDDILDKWIKVR